MLSSLLTLPMKMVSLKPISAIRIADIAQTQKVPLLHFTGSGGLITGWYSLIIAVLFGLNLVSTVWFKEKEITVKEIPRSSGQLIFLTAIILFITSTNKKRQKNIAIFMIMYDSGWRCFIACADLFSGTFLAHE